MEKTTKMKFVGRERHGKTLSILLEKTKEIVIPFCSFLHDIGAEVDEFDVEYEDFSDDHIHYENEKIVVDLIVTDKYLHLLVRCDDHKNILKILEKYTEVRS